ncbi:MAG TPA: type II toxin-antitoxin system death-on-curing family toxin [Terracidiphilus sp.]|nr:type II toxin-antitoxin system death-on-curing family toxin [Terracidiphilus sp.]
MTAPKWRWIKEGSVLAIHEMQIAEHGGLAGIRDLPLLQSGLARPLNLAAYSTPDIADLAASYAFGIARNHPFLDGNKRTAWVVAEAFLLKNGRILTANDGDSLVVMLSVAEGSMTEPEFAAWLRGNLQPLELN